MSEIDRYVVEIERIEGWTRDGQRKEVHNKDKTGSQGRGSRTVIQSQRTEPVEGHPRPS